MEYRIEEASAIHHVFQTDTGAAAGDPVNDLPAGQGQVIPTEIISQILVAVYGVIRQIQLFRIIIIDNRQQLTVILVFLQLAQNAFRGYLRGKILMKLFGDIIFLSQQKQLMTNFIDGS